MPTKSQYTGNSLGEVVEKSKNNPSLNQKVYMSRELGLIDKECFNEAKEYNVGINEQLKKENIDDPKMREFKRGICVGWTVTWLEKMFINSNFVFLEEDEISQMVNEFQIPYGDAYDSRKAKFSNMFDHFVDAMKDDKCNRTVIDHTSKSKCQIIVVKFLKDDKPINRGHVIGVYVDDNNIYVCDSNYGYFQYEPTKWEKVIEDIRNTYSQENNEKLKFAESKTYSLIL